jgi:hypothetical protein
MAAKDKNIFNLGGVNLKINPLLVKDGDMLRSLNVTNDTNGAKKKRPGYVTFLDAPTSDPVTKLFEWGKDDGTTSFLYRASGSVLYYYNIGVGTQTTWLPTGNGTFSSGFTPGFGVLENTLMVGDGVGSTRHSTNGTSFTNTTAAPIAAYFQEYQNRIYAAGTASTLFYSTTGDATNWSNAGTSDSSSLQIPGEGAINGLFKLSDRLVPTKQPGAMFRWDGLTLVDGATKLAPSSANSFDRVEGVGFYLNRLGVFTSSGNQPQLISNPVQKYIYNDDQTGVAGTQFDTAPGVAYNYNYLVSVGDVTDDLTTEQITNAILSYDYQLNVWDVWQFANLPTAYTTYLDSSRNTQLVFGDSSGNTYTYGGTATSDNGASINVEMEFVIHMDQPALDKKFNNFTGFFNPGCEGQAFYASSNSFTRGQKNWQSMGDIVNGVVDYRFAQGTQDKLLFIKIVESSSASRLNFYGFSINAEIQPRRT